MQKLYKVKLNGLDFMEGTLKEIASSIGTTKEEVKACSIAQKVLYKGKDDYVIYPICSDFERLYKVTNEILSDWDKTLVKIRGNKVKEEEPQRKGGLTWYYDEIIGKTNEDFKREHKEIVNDLKKCHYF